MVMTVNPLVILFIQVMLFVFAICYVYSLWKHYITDRTFADAETIRLQSIQKQFPEGIFIRNEPENKFLLTILYRVQNPYDVTLEKVRFMSQYISSKIKKGKIEWIVMVPFDNVEYNRQAERLGRVFPGVTTARVAENQINEFTVGALRARGKYIIHADFLEEELERVLEQGDRHFISLTSMEVNNSAIKSTAEIILKSVEKSAAWNIFRSVHTSKYGITREIVKLCEQYDVKIISEKKDTPNEHTLVYWCWIYLCEKFVDLMYRFKLWTYRK